MSVQFKDYYKTLEVERKASQNEIQKSFRRLARKYHPDVNKSPDAETRFKEINEAYEVLKDPEKRKRYDSLGANWKSGQSFTPPPGFEHFNFNFGGGESMGGFSDFFQSIFGDLVGGFGGVNQGRSRQGRGFGQKGQDHEAVIEVSLADVIHGAKKTIHLQQQIPDPAGRMNTKTVSYDVTIPKGVTDGSRIRLPRQGGAGFGGGQAGDLYLTIRIHPDSRYDVDGHNLKTILEITPWEAALGSDIRVETPDGAVKLKIPAGTSSGCSFRLKEKGIPKRGGNPGDLLVMVKIVVPKKLTSREKELFEQLAKDSRFKPRT